MKHLFPALLFVGLVAAAPDASARSHRVSQLPHGDSFGCTSCHTSPSGGGIFTGFGSAATLYLTGDGHISTQDLNWGPMAELDSDRDGFTNGEEVGDPQGTWVIGDRDPAGRFFNPGNPDDHPLATCGDGRVTPPEECDGSNFAGLSCFGLGLDDGTLRCKSDCSFDRSGCAGTPDAGPTGGGDEDMGVADETPHDDPACSTVPDRRSPVPIAAAVLLFALVAIQRRRRAH